MINETEIREFFDKTNKNIIYIITEERTYTIKSINQFEKITKDAIHIIKEEAKSSPQWYAKDVIPLNKILRISYDGILKTKEGGKSDE